MTLQSSGPISIGNIQTEFGGASPASINNYYRGGSHVPDGIFTKSIPTSGAISLSNFYGTSKTTQVFVMNAGFSSANAAEGYFYGLFGTLNPFSYSNGFYVMSAMYSTFQSGSYTLNIAIDGSLPSVTAQNSFTSLTFVDNTSTLRTFLTSAATYTNHGTYATFVWPAISYYFTTGSNYNININL